MRCGTKIYKGVIVPENARIFTSKSGRECYLSGIKSDSQQRYKPFPAIAIIKFIDDESYTEVDYDKIVGYL